MIDLLTTGAWQMTYSERAALEGILAAANPALSIEIGTAEGGSLRRIAAHSDEVHSFDLVEPAQEIRELENVTLHTGDSHVLLAEVLAEFERVGRNVDFALVDGDHTAQGVRLDMEALLNSPAVGNCTILIHDTVNDIVRGGLELVPYDSYPKVAIHDLDFLAGHLSNGGVYHHQLWGGLGLVVCDDAPGAARPEPPFYSSFELFAAARDALTGAPAGSVPRDAVAGLATREAVLEAELEHIRGVLDSVTGSLSWKGTAPLRELKRRYQSRQRT